MAMLANCGGQAKQPSHSAAPQEEAGAADSTEVPPEKTGPNCSDGSCIVCGDATCPKGFFCDESEGKPNCQWVPTCSNTVNCNCVKKTVSEDCDCSERDGGAYVRCKQ